MKIPLKKFYKPQNVEMKSKRLSHHYLENQHEAVPPNLMPEPQHLVPEVLKHKQRTKIIFSNKYTSGVHSGSCSLTSDIFWMSGFSSTEFSSVPVSKAGKLTALIQDASSFSQGDACYQKHFFCCCKILIFNKLVLHYLEFLEIL